MVRWRDVVSIHNLKKRSKYTSIHYSVYTVHPISSSFQSHPPERNNPLWFRSFSDGPTGARRRRQRRQLRRQHQRMALEGERFSRPKSSFIFPTNTTMLLASGGAPHHDFHSECTMSNDDKGNAKDCIHS